MGRRKPYAGQERGRVPKEAKKVPRPKCRIVIQDTEDPQMRYFHVNRLLCRASEAFFFFPFDSEENEDERARVGVTGNNLAGNLFRIEGVEECHLSPYSVAVRIGGAFHWDELQPGILELIAQIVFPVESGTRDFTNERECQVWMLDKVMNPEETDLNYVPLPSLAVNL